MKFNLDKDSIKYVKMVYSDKSNTQHCIKAAVKEMNDCEIYACAKSDDALFIKTPQEVQLSLICEDGLYRSGTMLKYVENKDSCVYFMIKNPDECEYQQKREYFRVRMPDKIHLIFDGNMIESAIYDISANGICLELENVIDIPQNVVLEILFPEKKIRTEAEYIRTDAEDGIIKASFHLINLPESDRDFISQKCIRKQLEEKRKQLEM